MPDFDWDMASYAERLVAGLVDNNRDTTVQRFGVRNQYSSSEMVSFGGAETVDAEKGSGKSTCLANTAMGTVSISARCDWSVLGFLKREICHSNAFMSRS